MTKTKAKLAGNKTRSAAHKRQASKPKTPRKTKATLMREMLEVEGGASLDDLCNATGWQPHTVRAALSGLRKAGHVIDRTRDDAGKSIYRVTATGGAT
ncbi:MAG: DUF3489 domain-containing protein [Silicimonas sp.]|jgi:DNA-binding transcriptional regulator PaaX|uniref:DUF3489 domain-containing protein n=1 Tax=Alphaproteobacteria TaxID=28211 RepID=UPI00260E49A0|nr:DUF3489 domain-containing protein [Roseovarius sp.]MDM8166315.1 DUF3489 domain-containing protein [Roseovarius sp.]